MIALRKVMMPSTKTFIVGHKDCTTKITRPLATSTQGMGQHDRQQCLHRQSLWYIAMAITQTFQYNSEKYYVLLYLGTPRGAQGVGREDSVVVEQAVHGPVEAVRDPEVPARRTGLACYVAASDYHAGQCGRCLSKVPALLI